MEQLLTNFNIGNFTKALEFATSAEQESPIESKVYAIRSLLAIGNFQQAQVLASQSTDVHPIFQFAAILAGFRLNGQPQALRQLAAKLVEENAPKATSPSRSASPNHGGMSKGPLDALLATMAAEWLLEDGLLVEDCTYCYVY
jgi:hypothetical protein